MNESPRRLRSPAFTLLEIMVVVVIIGLLVMMAIPVVLHVQRESQNKTVLNNMRQLDAAANMYFFENATTTADVTSLVGSDLYVKQLSTIAQEYYPMNFTQGDPIIVSGIGGARTLTYLQ